MFLSLALTTILYGVALAGAGGLVIVGALKLTESNNNSSSSAAPSLPAAAPAREPALPSVLEEGAAAA